MSPSARYLRAQDRLPRGAHYELWNYKLPGLLGSTFLTIGSFGVGWFPLSAQILQNSAINYLQTQPLGQALARASVVVGAALLLQAWLVVGLDAFHGFIPRAKTIYWTLLSWIAPLIVAPPLFSRDVYSYYMQGQLQLDGHDPYASGVSLVEGWFSSGVDPLWGDAPTPYGPAFLLIEKYIASISGGSALTAAILFRLVSVIGIAITAWGIASIARHHGISDIAALWLGIMNPLVIMHFVAGAHNDSLMVGFICAGIAVALRRHWMLGTILVTLGLGIKPVALVALPFIAFIAAGTRSRWAARFQYFVRVGVVSVLTLLVTALFAQVTPFGWISALSTPGTVQSWLSPATAVGMLWGDSLALMGFGEHTATTVSITRAIGSLFMVITMAWLIFKTRGRSATQGAALSFVALVALGPVVQPWYLLWSIPLLAATGLTHHRMRVVVLVIAAFTVHGIANSSATADTFLDFSDGLAMVLAGITLALVMLTSRRERTLLLGSSDEIGLIPETASQYEKHLARTMH